MNAKRIYRLYDEENLKVRSVGTQENRVADTACHKAKLLSRTIAGLRTSSATSWLTAGRFVSSRSLISSRENASARKWIARGVVSKW